MKTKILVLVLMLALLLAVAGAALANGGDELPREVLSGGASDATAPGVSLRATLGQPVVGVPSAAGYVSLGQGFWRGRAEAEYPVHLPLLLKK